MLKALIGFLYLFVGTAEIVDCGKGTQFQLTQLALNPEPPIAGQDVLMTVVFQNPGPEITDGTVTTSFSLNGLPFTPTIEPLCTNTECPIIVGENDRSAVSQWPTGISGKLVSTIEWVDVNQKPLLCIKITERLQTNRLRKSNALVVKVSPES